VTSRIDPTVPEAAAMLGVTVDVVEAWIVRGEIAVRPLGIDHVRRVSRRAVDELRAGPRAGRWPPADH
jgi:excisionase family DNA binding protein